MPRPLEVLVWDEPDACPYLPGQTSRLPLRWPRRRLSLAEFEQRLEQGDRRSGTFLYSPQCPGCQACEPIRLDVTTFAPSTTQARTWKRGQQRFRTEIGPCQATDERLRLYNRHKVERGLETHERETTIEDYEQFLVDSCCVSQELAYYLDDRLVMVAIIDIGEQSLSAVYTYFDPDISQHSPGVYSVLKQVDLCREWGKRYLYLGYYVAGSQHMQYKATYRPHERRVDGRWEVFA